MSIFDQVCKGYNIDPRSGRSCARVSPKGRQWTSNMRTASGQPPKSAVITRLTFGSYQMGCWTSAVPARTGVLVASPTTCPASTSSRWPPPPITWGLLQGNHALSSTAPPTTTAAKAPKPRHRPAPCSNHHLSLTKSATSSIWPSNGWLTQVQAVLGCRRYPPSSSDQQAVARRAQPGLCALRKSWGFEEVAGSASFADAEPRRVTHRQAGATGHLCAGLQSGA